MLDKMLCFHDFWCVLFFFFFSSRRRHTRLVSDWSSDVCSSDLSTSTSTSTSTTVCAVCDSPPGVCSIDIDSQKPFCSGSTCSLASAIAVVAKTNTSASAPTRTITIHNRCTGDPVLIDGLFNLLITGDPPSDQSHNLCS